MGSLSTMQKAAFGGWLWTANHLARKIETEMPDWMPFEQYDVLVRLELEESGRLRLSELAESVVISRSGLTRLIDRLEEKGWVTRETCPKDRRGAYAVLTDDGRAKRVEAWPFLHAAIEKHFADKLCPGDEETIVELTTKMSGCEPLLLVCEREGRL